MGLTVAWSYVAATLTRALFLAHSVVAVWRVVVIKNPRYWILLWTAVISIMEAPMVLIKRKGNEFKRFSPSFFLYLCTVLPPIWILEHHRLNVGQQPSTAVTPANTAANLTSTDTVFNPSDQQWLLLVEQTFPLLLVIGRWLMPNAGLSHEQLSHLLIEYLGITSDIMELFALFDNQQVLARHSVVYAILAIWSISLLQFTIVLTKSDSNEPAADGKAHRSCEGFTLEVASVAANMLLQEIPFFIIRVYVMAVLNVIDYTTFFFAGKNALVILIQSYRLIALFCVRHSCATCSAKSN